MVRCIAIVRILLRMNEFIFFLSKRRQTQLNVNTVKHHIFRTHFSLGSLWKDFPFNKIF